MERRRKRTSARGGERVERWWTGEGGRRREGVAEQEREIARKAELPTEEISARV